MKIELVAAESLTVDPVAIAFDRRGRVFFTGYRDYPTGPSQQNGPPISRVVILQNTDGDGRMDRRHVFAAHLKFTHSLVVWNDEILVPGAGQDFPSTIASFNVRSSVPAT